MKKNQGNLNSQNNNAQQSSHGNNVNKGRQSATGTKKTAHSNVNITSQNSNASTNNNSQQSQHNQEEKKRPQTNADKYKANNLNQNKNILHRQSIQSVTNLHERNSKHEIGYNQEISGDHEFASDQASLSQQNTIQLSEDQQNIVKMVSAYLLKYGCARSNEIFLKEIYKQQHPSNKKQVTINTLLNAFQKGKRDLFFGQWASLPHTNQPNQIDKLEFYLQIYFLIYEIHPLYNSKEKIGNDRIEYFRQYLDSKGSELSKTTELLSYYALPYIQKPQEHQNFKSLFTTEWVQDLQKKLKHALEKLVNEEEQHSPLEKLYFESMNQNKDQQGKQNIQNGQNLGNGQQQYPIPYAPSLQQHFHGGSNAPTPMNNVNISYLQNDLSYLPDNSYITDNNSLRANNDQYLRVLQELNSRYSNLHKVYIQVQEQAKQAIMDSHQKWFKLGQDLVTLSKELITMVDQASKGHSPQPQVFESKKKKLGQFEHFLSSNIDDLVQQSLDISLFDKQVSMIEYDQSPIIQQYKVQQPGFNGQILSQNIQNDQQHQQMQKNNLNNNNPIKNMNSNQIQHDFQISDIHQQQHLQQQYTDNPNEYQSYAPIDFNKIKQALKQESHFQNKISILQALRWRIAKTRNAYQRREVIISFTLNDILGCSKSDIQLQNAIFNSPDERLTEFGLRLVNALASDFEGRTYLVESETLVKLLISILRREQEDSCTRRNALGALQKLSLRKKPQIVMIQNDLIRWIVETLRNEKDNLSEYSYEYATALFMNLSLRSLGRDKCEDEDLYVLEVLQQLLEHENQQVRTFVNGTLYSLLSRPALKEQSRQLSLLQYLIHLRDNSDERFNKQLQYIINQLEKPDEEEEEENMSDQEEDNDEDDIEDEDMDDEDEQDEYLDHLEVSGNDAQQLIGENLLIQQFNLRGQEALRQHNLTRTALEESKKNAHNASMLNQSRINNRPEPFNRPATPSLSVSQISHSQINDTKKTKQQTIQLQQQQYYQKNNQENIAIMQQQQMYQQQKQQMQQQQHYQQQHYQQQNYNQQINMHHPQQKYDAHNQYNNSPQTYNEVQDYGKYSSDGKGAHHNQQYNQQQIQNHQQQQPQLNSKAKSPQNQNTVPENQGAFAARPKIPRTPPTQKDEKDDQ